MTILRKLFAGLILSLFVFTAIAAPADSNGAQFTPNQVKQIQTIIQDYLIKNPEVLVQASQALRQQQMAKMQKAAMKGISENKQALFNDPNSPTAGNPNGSVILVEFFDYQCGHCKTMNQIVQNLVKKNKNLKVIFKEFPIFGANSQYAAKAALAAAAQNKYYQFHDAMLASQNPLSNQKVQQIAKKIGLNFNMIQKAMNSKQINQQLRDNFSLARKIRLVGTPAFVLTNKSMTKFKFVPGATSEQDLQKLIDELKTNDTNKSS